jgi:hypothetical protein
MIRTIPGSSSGIQQISGRRREDAPLSVPEPSGKPVDQVDSNATVSGRLPSPNIGTGPITAQITYNKFGHNVNASLAGHGASIPREQHQLGIHTSIDENA